MIAIMCSDVESDIFITYSYFQSEIDLITTKNDEPILDVHLDELQFKYAGIYTSRIGRSILSVSDMEIT